MGKLTVLAVLVTVFASVHGSSYIASQYPSIVSGFSNHIYNYQPQVGQFNCLSYWCRSSYTNQYYCCTTPQQQFIANQGFVNHNVNRPVIAGQGYNPYNPYNQVNPYNRPYNSHSPFNPYNG